MGTAVGGVDVAAVAAVIVELARVVVTMAVVDVVCYGLCPKRQASSSLMPWHH